ncbi:hypothetical protein M3Y96_00424200 [Aphelenchoides besseyi]|nr:hypothetical protein M3Y96_00424200 [Aphelenchoides besseyi]
MTTIKEPVESIQELRLKARVSEAGNVVQILEQIHSKFPQLKHLNVQFEENNPECNWTKKFLETADFSKVWNHIEENKANETLKLEYWDNFLAFQVYAQLSTISNAYDFDYIDAATNRSYFY